MNNQDLARAVAVAQQLYYVRTDMEGNYTYVNELFKQRFSFITDDFIGMPFADSIHPDDVQNCLDAIELCFAYPQKNISLQIRKPRPDGLHFISYWEFFILFDEQRQPREIGCLGFDLTKLHEALQENKKRVRQVENILESISDGFVTLDHDDVVTRVNKSYEKIIGFSREEQLNKTIYELFEVTEDNPFHLAYQKVKHQRVPVTIEDYHPEPLNIWLEANFYPIASGVAIYFKDITHRKAQEQKLLYQKNRLQKIASMQSHDLRGPISGILGQLELLSREQIPEDVQELVKNISAYALQADQMIRNIVKEANAVEQNELIK